MSDSPQPTPVLKPSLPPPSPVIPKGRLTVVEMVYVQTPNAGPVAVESRYGVWIESDEQPYTRRLTVGPEWQPLDLGWLRDVPIALIHLSNEGYGRSLVTPTAEQSATLTEHIVEVSATRQYVLFSYLSPGESLRVPPPGVVDWYVRCPNGRSTCVLNVIPR